MHQICLTVAVLNQEIIFTFLKYSFEEHNASGTILCVLYCGKATNHGPRSHHAKYCKTQNQTVTAKISQYLRSLLGHFVLLLAHLLQGLQMKKFNGLGIILGEVPNRIGWKKCLNAFSIWQLVQDC